MRRVALLFWLAAALTAVAFISNASCQKEVSVTVKKDYSGEIALFAKVLSIVRAEYIDADMAAPKKLIYGALDGMVSHLDPYSQFLGPDEFKQMKIETEGQFGGIGVEITIKDGLLTIIAPIEGTPAAKAGLAAGDRIVKIDGKSTKDIKLRESVKKLRGTPGTSVTVTVLREEEKKVLDFTITRVLIKIKSVKEAKIIDQTDKIGYIKLVEFQQKTALELDAALLKLKAEGMQALILDLRNNPGGLFDTAVEVSERFIPKGEVIVSTKARTPQQNVTFLSEGRGLYLDFPMVVLVNKGSASGSEIVAGAIQDQKRGIILGTKTFGKGSVQTVIPMDDGSAVRLTTAKYYTPSEKVINAEGIMPDIVVENGKLVPQEEIDIFQEIEEIKPEGKSIKQNKKQKQINKPNQTRIEPKPPDAKQPYDHQLARAVDLLKGIKAYKGFLQQQTTKKDENK